MQQLRQEFFDGYIGLHPEEATTLGLTEGAERLRDHRPEALDAEQRWLSAMKARLDALDEASLSVDERLDRLSMQRLVDHHLHAMPWLYRTIDFSMYPYAMLEVQLLHAVSAEEKAVASQRARQVPRFLEQQATNVDAAIASRLRLPDTTLRDFFVSTQLPAAIESLRSMGYEDAAAAYERHGAWMAELETADMRSIGPQELRTRLRLMLGIEEEPEALVAQAGEDLAEIQEDIVRVAAAAAPRRAIRDLSGARQLAFEMQQVKLDTDDVIGFFRAYVTRATAVVREQRLFDLPDDYVMGIDILPRSMALAVAAGNWPAPLKDRSKLGHYLVAADPQLHLVAWAADGAVHEGLPGHHLQSFLWQRRFADEPAPVRFLVVHDHVAIPRHFWAPMLNIEGWAVYAEELMRKAGFFTPDEELFVLLAHAVRAARVVCDMSLAAGTMSQDEVQQLLMREACMARGAAWLEARRYAQAPLQASTYHLGRKAIDALAAESDDLAAFHERFLSLGPVDPRALLQDPRLRAG